MTAAALRPGDRFFVEPLKGERIEVIVAALSYWDLVYGQLNIPCRRPDTDEDVIVVIDFREEVEQP